MALLEIACFNSENAIAAWNAGADRLELCDGREVGGTTPSLGSVEKVKHQVTIPVYAMVRPRGGDFIFSEEEFKQMKNGIDILRPQVNGYVLGILDQHCNVDISRTTELVQRAAPLPCTFHRAFDETPDQLQAFEDIIACGCRAILSSGGAVNAVSGALKLRELVETGKGRIEVIPGGGVRARNLADLHAITKANAYHSSALIDDRTEPDSSEIRRMKLQLREHALDLIDSDDLAARAEHALPGHLETDSAEPSHMHLSAVSIGANTPIDELYRPL